MTDAMLILEAIDHVVECIGALCALNVVSNLMIAAILIKLVWLETK